MTKSMSQGQRLPGVGKKMARALTLQCPLCKSRGLFSRWVKMVDDCPRCGLHFERIEGHWIGAIGINTIVSFGALVITIIIGAVATFPDFPVFELTALSVAVALIVPIVFYPVSKTLWTAVDLSMRPLEPDEVDLAEIRP